MTIPTSPAAPGPLARALVAAILVAHAGLLAWSATRHVPTYDEVGHLPAGLSHLQFGRFDLYCVNPPLVRTVAALPLLAADPVTDWGHYHSGWRPEWTVGLDFLKANPDRSLRLFTLGRWACIPFCLLGGFVCWRWGRELYGTRAGLLALTLWAFCPTVLGHGQLVTPDVAAAAVGVLAGYAFWRWLKNPTLLGATAAGVCLGLCLLVKSTWVILFALWPAMWLLAGARWRTGGQLALALVLGLTVLNAGYGFERTGRRLGDFEFKSVALTGHPHAENPESAPGTNKFRGTWLEEVPVPLPANFVRGVDLQKFDFESDAHSYLRGEWKRGGWWYYYLYGMAVKVPVGTWVLFTVAVLVVLGRRSALDRRDELALLAPVVAVLVLVSSQTGLNHHYRYVLPALPFLFVWCGKVVLLTRGSARVVVALALAWSVGSSLSVYPHGLSYFNELAGGPTNGPAHLLGSSVDWGQDLLYLKEWAAENPDARPLWLAYDNVAAPEVLGFRDSAPVPTGVPRRPGWYAISVNALRDQSGQYADFLDRRPVGRVGYTTYIYRVTAEDPIGSDGAHAIRDAVAR